jgi:hypothetical protein
VTRDTFWLNRETGSAKEDAVAMNAGEISNQPIRKEKQSLGTDDCDVTPSCADDAGLKIAYKRDRHLPCASTNASLIPDRPNGNDRLYEARGIGVRPTRAVQRRRICAAKRSAAIQIADLTSRMVDGYPERITPLCRERP